jgi:acetyl-CoA carboxylase carboxyl transferase subunit beta
MKLDFLKRKKWVRLELSSQDVKEAAALREAAGLRQSLPTPTVTPSPPVTSPAHTEGSSHNAKTAQNVTAAPKTPGPDEAACPSCGAIHSKQRWERSFKVCDQCGKHGRINSEERVAQVVDSGTFSPVAKEVTSVDPLAFPGYQEKLDKAMLQSEAGDAVLTGTGCIDGIPAALFIMEPDFMMGSLGSAAGERITRLIETAIENRLPVIGFCASGGARMQEGILSLMQMAKTSAALGRLSAEGLPYIAVLTDPTTGGVTASYAMLGDVILAEPGALIGFAGQRVIEQTIRQSLPEGFQRAEFLVEKGFVDRIVHRAEMKAALAKLLRLHGFAPALADAASKAVNLQGGEAHVS